MPSVRRQMTDAGAEAVAAQQQRLEKLEELPAFAALESVALKHELAGMNGRRLVKYCEEMGIEEAKIEQADAPTDKDERRAALLALVLERHAEEVAAANSGALTSQRAASPAPAPAPQPSEEEPPAPPAKPQPKRQLRFSERERAKRPEPDGGPPWAASAREEAEYQSESHLRNGFVIEGFDKVDGSLPFADWDGCGLSGGPRAISGSFPLYTQKVSSFVSVRVGLYWSMKGQAWHLLTNFTEARAKAGECDAMTRPIGFGEVPIGKHTWTCLVDGEWADRQLTLTRWSHVAKAAEQRACAEQEAKGMLWLRRIRGELGNAGVSVSVDHVATWSSELQQFKSDPFETVAVPVAAVKQGKVFYEVELLQYNRQHCQFGWANRGFLEDSDEAHTEEGCGDDESSWAVGSSSDDDEKSVTWFAGDHWAPPFGEVWAEGDVLGFAADLDKRTMMFGHNGRWSVVFEDYISKCEDAAEDVDKHLFPALSVSTTGEPVKVRISLGGTKRQGCQQWKYGPPDWKGPFDATKEMPKDETSEWMSVDCAAPLVEGVAKLAWTQHVLDKPATAEPVGSELDVEALAKLKEDVFAESWSVPVQPGAALMNCLRQAQNMALARTDVANPHCEDLYTQVIPRAFHCVMDEHAVDSWSEATLQNIFRVCLDLLKLLAIKFGTCHYEMTNKEAWIFYELHVPLQTVLDARTRFHKKVRDEPSILSKTSAARTVWASPRKEKSGAMSHVWLTELLEWFGENGGFHNLRQLAPRFESNILKKLENMEKTKEVVATRDLSLRTALGWADSYLCCFQGEAATRLSGATLEQYFEPIRGNSLRILALLSPMLGSARKDQPKGLGLERRKPCANDILDLRVRAQDGTDTYFKLRRTQKLRKLVQAWSSRQGAAESVDETNYFFLFNGDRIVPTKTPEDLYMITDDVIHTEG